MASLWGHARMKAARQRNRDGTTAYTTLATWDMLRLGTITESLEGSMLVGNGPSCS